MIKKVFISMCFCMVTMLDAQEKSKLVFGGTVSVDIGRFNDRFELTPTLHTKVFQKFYFGIGVTMAHYKQESIGYLMDHQDLAVETYNISTKTTYYGMNLFTRYFPFESKKGAYKNLYLQSEFEFLKGTGKYLDPTGSYKFNTNNRTIFTGIGYKHQIGNKFALNASILIKMNHESNSPYKNPIIRIGFEF